MCVQMGTVKVQPSNYYLSKSKVLEIKFGGIAVNFPYIVRYFNTNRQIEVFKRVKANEHDF